MAKEQEDITIWVEKYRPKEFEQVAGQQDIVKRLKAFVSAKNLPHLLFAGPAGSGKTTLALIIAHKLFKEKWRENFLELNASDERGIDVIRQKVKAFARTKAFSGPFKIIFLDEADALTREAQQALRRTMEQFTGTCRFILSCNYSSKIIDPIQSRCAVFRFRVRDKKDVERTVDEIAKTEKLKVLPKAINVLYEISQGDLRKVINVLQACAIISKNIDEKLIYEMSSEIKPDDVKIMLQLALEGKFLDARNLLLDLILKQGLSGLDIIKAIQKEIWNLNISEENKIKLIERCAEIEFRLVEGSDEFIQLEALLASFIGKK
ncbi:MAG: replication factor C small subunit [Candidatus Pacearchaeota archaeon]